MRAVIVASGDVAQADVRHLDDADLVVAADGGANALEGMGVRPDRLVGDLDSVDPDLAERLAAAGTLVERHPTDKEASDTELAVGAALEAGATEVVVIGGLGGERLDHELATILLLADARFADLPIRLARGPTTVRVVRGGHRLALLGAEGDIVTLLPIGGPARGVTTDGLRWPLDGATLEVGRSRGLSNEVTAAPASVSVEDGVVLVIETAHERSTS